MRSRSDRSTAGARSGSCPADAASCSRCSGRRRLAVSDRARERLLGVAAGARLRDEPRDRRGATAEALPDGARAPVVALRGGAVLSRVAARPARLLPRARSDWPRGHARPESSSFSCGRSTCSPRARRPQRVEFGVDTRSLSILDRLPARAPPRRASGQRAADPAAARARRPRAVLVALDRHRLEAVAVRRAAPRRRRSAPRFSSCRPSTARARSRAFSRSRRWSSWGGSRTACTSGTCRSSRRSASWARGCTPMADPGRRGRGRSPRPRRTTSSSGRSCGARAAPLQTCGAWAPAPVPEGVVVVQPR